MSFEAVVFDLDYTLYDESEYFTAVFEAYCQANHVECVPQMLACYKEKRAVSANIFHDVLAHAQCSTSQESLDALFELYTSITCSLTPYDGMISLLESLRSRGVKLGLITNGSVEGQANKVRCLGIASYFDSIVYARSQGKKCEKPHISGYNSLEESLKLKGDTMIFIGDNPKTDFKGAKAIGGRTIRLKMGLYTHFPSTEDVDTEVDSVEQLAALL